MLAENSLQLATQVWQSSMASSNSRIAYIHACMFTVPFLTTSLRAASAASPKLKLRLPGASKKGAPNVKVVPSSAASAQSSAYVKLP